MSNKVFDVTRPGKSAPSSTSKPIITSNRPILKDPMMVDEDKTTDQTTETTHSPVTVSSKIKVEPIHADVTPEDVNDKKILNKDESEAKDDKKEPVIDDEVESIKLVDQQDTPTKDDKKDSKEKAELVEDTLESKDDEPTPKSSSTTEPTDQTSQAAQEKINEVATRKAAEHAAEIQKLALSHKYFLPINQVEKRRNKHAAWAGAVLVLLLAIVWADVALDAGLVTIPGVKPPTHFFK